MVARLARVVESACQEAGLSLPQYRALLFVAEQPQRARDLASKIAVSRPAITDLVDGLERQGCLRRIPVEGDRRGIGLELTDEGAAAMSRAETSIAERLAPLVSDESLLRDLASLEPVLDAALERALREAAGESEAVRS